MTNQRYKEIRTQKDFIYKYFVEESGNTVPQNMFYQLFGLWLNIIGFEEQSGVYTIAAWLDKKHEYKK